jgi:glyoxylase-like metal-dependent hydrolase (beta-lactamase superfamily II)
VVNRSAADALAELDMTPGDIDLVINTHLHFDHCGQNAVFPHAACYVKRAELDRAKREAPELYDWFGGHQSVVVQTADGAPDLLIGDAAYTPRQYLGPPDEDLPDGQASDPAAWRDSLARIRSTGPGRVHFCHHTDVIHS